MDHGAETNSLLGHFAELKDPRQLAKVLYPLPEVLLLVLCATLAGADDFVEIEGRDAPGVPAALLGLRARHPEP
jgi:hypothetical protein